jgi:hypothetical protein
MVMKCTNIFHSKALQYKHKLGIFGMKINHLAYFQTKNPILGKFVRDLQWKILVGFMAI